MASPKAAAVRQGVQQLPSCVLLVLLLAGPAAAQRSLAAQPEPSCNSNRNEGNEVWSVVPNFIGPGAGQHWWGNKVAAAAVPAAAATPVSWVDYCAQQLEVCQADSTVAGSTSGFKELCVCDMWTCLNLPHDSASAAPADSRPLCLHSRPYLQNYYCNAARAVNSTCSSAKWVPLPTGSSCPVTPAEGLTFDDMPGDGITIPNGYQGLLWDNFHMLNGDAYQVANGYYSGVITSPNVAFNGYGYPATISAPINGLLTLHSLYLTSAWDEENSVTITADNALEETVGTYKLTLYTDAPVLVDLAAPAAGSLTGTFAGVSSITIATRGTQVALDNLHITLSAQPGKKIQPPPAGDLEFWDAPPGASGPGRKAPRLKRGAEAATARNATGAAEAAAPKQQQQGPKRLFLL